MRYLLALLTLTSSLLGDALVPETRKATNHWTAWVGARNAYRDLSGKTIFTNHSPGVTVASINNSISLCPSNQIVKFAAGTYTLNGTISLDQRRGVILQGSTNWPLGGMHTFGSATIFNFTNHSGDCYIQCRNPYHEGVGGFNTATWSSPFTAGSDTFTLTSVASMAVGDIILLDQENDQANGETSFGGEGTCGTCDPELDGSHVKQWSVIVTNISGLTIGVQPPLVGTNWNRASSFNPRALWTTDQVGGDQNGIANIFITASNAPSKPYAMVRVRWIHDFFMQDCAITDSQNIGFLSTEANFIGIHNVWFKNCGINHASQSYSFAAFGGGHILITDSIFAPYTSGIIMNGGGGGHVFSYNFFTNSQFEGVSATAIASSIGIHAGYHHHSLAEGNYGQKFDQDNIHGSSGYMSTIRNRWTGWQTNKTSQTTPMQIYGTNWFGNHVGNILGTASFHTSYEHDGTGDTGTQPIWLMGFWDASGFGTEGWDPNVKTTTIRRGNYNTFDAAIPSSEALGGDALPESYYLTSAPANFGSLTWPPFNPNTPTSPDSESAKQIPAGYRFYNGTNPPASAGGGGGETGGSGKGRGQKGSGGRGKFK